MIIIPPNYVADKLPTIFLAGPIPGTYKWREKAFEHLDKPGWRIASPARGRHPDDATFFTEQVAWETHWLRESDIILFYLAEETEHKCKRAFAQTTRFELGEWLVRDPAKVVIGADASFTGLRYIRERFPLIPIHDSIEAACRAVLTKLA